MSTTPSDYILPDGWQVDPSFAEAPDDVDKVLQTCEDLGGISAEYLYHEFVLMMEDASKYHDADYLKIDWRLS